jgi:hypothetical protein
VFWLARPPYLRWVAIGAMIAVAIVVDLGDRRTESAPFAARDIARGDAVMETSIRWRDVPVGLMSTMIPKDAVAVRDIAEGEPITAGAVTVHRPPPDGWWTLELEIPDTATQGRRARVVVSDPVLATEALVVSVSAGGRFGGGATGLVAVPPDFADQIARAAAKGRVSVLLAP